MKISARNTLQAPGTTLCMRGTRLGGSRTPEPHPAPCATPRLQPWNPPSPAP